jgi:hypothetical protein
VIAEIGKIPDHGRNVVRVDAGRRLVTIKLRSHKVMRRTTVEMLRRRGYQ